MWGNIFNLLNAHLIFIHALKTLYLNPHLRLELREVGLVIRQIIFIKSDQLNIDYIISDEIALQYNNYIILIKN